MEPVATDVVPTEPVPATLAEPGERVGAAPAAADGVADGATARVFRIARVAAVEVRLPEQHPTVVLEDVEQGEQISFRVGTAEGVSLAHVLHGSATPRPLTHDLFASVLERCGVDVLAVRVCGRVGAAHLAELELLGPGGREVLSCRPSDGICLALRRRVPAPILVDERLFTTDGDVEP